MADDDPVFVVPHYSDAPMAEEFLARMLDGLLAQTDPHWRVVIVDDGSPDVRDRARLRRQIAGLGDRAVLLQQEENRGQGICRNIGVAWAHEHCSPFVLFNDADDVSPPKRLEVTRQIFCDQPEVGFVYSTFTVVDAIGEPVPRGQLTPSVAEILDSHRNPVEGPHGWIRIGTETGYTSLTSTVSVRTGIALDHPFPSRGSEDAHTWLRMSAATDMWYEPSIPCQYRIPQQIAGSADRTRMGDEFYRRKAELDFEGFLMAASAAVDQGAVSEVEVPALRRSFLRRLAVTLQADGQVELAEMVLRAASESGEKESVRRLAGLGSDRGQERQPNLARARLP